MQVELPDFNSTLELIRSRRTVRSFDGRSVDDDVIRGIIDAARWAPNHRMTEPWRFYVLRKEGAVRQQVADLTFEWVLGNTPNRKQAESSAKAAREELLNAPALVYAYSLNGDSAELAEENYSATSCAVQNLMLAARAAGLGVGWSTGKPTRHPLIGQALKAAENSRIVGCLYIGYPAEEPDSHRQDVDAITNWL